MRNKAEDPENCQESPENPPSSPFFKGGTLISSLYQREGERDFQAIFKWLNCYKDFIFVHPGHFFVHRFCPMLTKKPSSGEIS
jgi:hypothetical protein